MFWIIINLEALFGLRGHPIKLDRKCESLPHLQRFICAKLHSSLGELKLSKRLALYLI